MDRGTTTKVAPSRDLPISRLGNWFLFSAGFILAVTGAAKIWSAFGNSKLLAQADPILGITFGNLMLAVGIIEIGIAAACFLSRLKSVPLGLVAWLSTNFLIYRLGLWWTGWKKPCSCLGNLTDALHLSPQVADNIMKVVLAYLLIGSYGLLFRQWRQKRRAANGITAVSPPQAATDS